MRQLPLNDGHTVSLFFSAAEIPVGRYTEFQYYLTQAVGIGSDSDAVEQHFSNLTARIAAAHNNPEQLAPAADELALLHYNFNFMLGRYQPKQLAFGVLVGAVDGQPANDLSEEALSALITRLNDYGLTQGYVEEAVEAFVKKKPRS